MLGIPRLRAWRRHPLATTIALGLLIALALAATALAASNNVHVSATKKQLSITGTAAASGDSVQVNFDPHKCASSYTAETKRTKVGFTDFQAKGAGHFKFTLHLPIPPPSGDKPGHYACTYLLEIVGQNIKPVASTSAKY
ncbi:MAG TPA: hypothetical protein VGP17_05030 [Solirubrobacteraceae bacterium]|jgi:hypothetical protein|nr:hypothetical protein [Solirubrobacteraceae bacterium]